MENKDLIHPELPLFKKGKVREVYELPDGNLLIVATDRVSAFDEVLPILVPDKGKLLTRMTNFWLRSINYSFPIIIPTHGTSLFGNVMGEYIKTITHSDIDVDPERSMIVSKVEALPLEAIVRGYLTGSGYKDYLKTGKVCGIELPKGLKDGDRLPNPIFTPSTKSDKRDVNISNEEFDDKFVSYSEDIRDMSLQLYKFAADYALKKGIIIADTKFEFGVNDDDDIMLIDEILTPDSSRFWPVNNHTPGQPQESFDKQIIRDYVKSLREGGVTISDIIIPQAVIYKTALKYYEIYTLLTEQKYAKF